MSHTLPIYEVLPQLKKILTTYNTALLQAPPGAGKSTALPIELLDEEWLAGKKILMLEPRRLAAKSVALRLADNLEDRVGNIAGYRVRFETCISSKTRIEVVTDGILTRMIQQDNALEDIGLILFDEFHERSLQADLALALVREVQKVLRDDLRILVMSATLASESIQKALGNCPLVLSEGRAFEVEEIYENPDSTLSFIQNIAKTIRKSIRDQQGDILVFLPGIKEISQVQEALGYIDESIAINVLYGELSPELQRVALIPDLQGRRKVILSTSIAETSLTIQGVKVVIDSGLSRVPRYDAGSGLTKLETIKVTLDSAEQRKGRAGRTEPGVCYRLWSKGSHQFLDTERKPEILEADLSSLMLELANWSGIEAIETMSWVDHPPKGALIHARDLLNSLDALDGDKISITGKELLKLPTHPRIAHMLNVSKKMGLLSLGIDIAALLDERDPFDRNAGADLVERVKALRVFRAGENRVNSRNALSRVEKLCSSWYRYFKLNSDKQSISIEDVGKLLALAYPERIAKQIEIGRYKLANGRIARLSDSDPLSREEWLVIANMDAGNMEGKIFVAASLNIADVEDIAKTKDIVEWDFRKGILVAARQKSIGAVLVHTQALQNIPEFLKIEALCHAIEKEGERLLDFDSVFALQNRVSSLRIWRPEEDWPDISSHSICNTCRDWLPFYASGIKKKEDFQKLDIHAILMGILTWEQQQKMDKLVPANIEVPSGSNIKIDYKADGSDPILSVRLQEMFGLPETPLVNEGRTKVLIHLLSPGYKPVQVTQDLKSFWKNTYPEVKKELKGRYPKHSWPDDPWTAEAVRGVKKKG
jgi:ATP-dependent helicase HrpB